MIVHDSPRIDVRQCSDAGVLLGILRDPSVYPWIADDTSPPADEFTIPGAILSSDLFLVPYVDDVAAGFAWFHAESMVLCSYHGALLPGFRGGLGVRIGRQVFDHFFENTSFEKVMALCPTNNPRAQRFNSAIGMQREGLLTKSYLSGGELRDLVLFGINRDKEIH